jgi:hypothetical protein
MCVNEEENQTILSNPAMMGEEMEMDSMFGDEIHEPEHSVRTDFIMAKRVNGICYWKPNNHSGPHHPVRVAHVTQCSRYTKRQDAQEENS